MPIMVELNSTSGSYTENQGDMILFAAANFLSSDDSLVDIVQITLGSALPSELLLAPSLPTHYISSYDSITGVLTISSDTGDISDVNWQSVLRSVLYSNSSDDPLGTHEISVVALDTIGPETSASIPITYTLTVVASNDAPVITGDLTATISEASDYVFTVVDLDEVDPDDAAGELIYTLISQTNGVVKLDGYTTSSFSAQDVIDGKVSFSHNGSETLSAGFEFSLSDGSENGIPPATGIFNFIVTPTNDPLTGAVTIEGTAQENATLTAITGTIADTDGLGAFSYQWLRDNVAISGATNGSYTLSTADIGAQISVSVSYTDGQSTLESLTSDPTVAVTGANQAPELAMPLVDQAVQYDTTNWSYDAGASFSDEDSLFFSATLVGGGALPAWIQINETTGILTGTPNFSNYGTYALEIIATDTRGLFVEDTLTLTVTAFDTGQLLVNTSANDVFAGTGANDTVTYAYATAPVTISLALTGSQNTGGAGLDILNNIDNLIGSSFDDNLVGNSQNNILDGGIGTDTLAGGLGNDNYIVNLASDIVIEKFNAGIDTIKNSVTYTLPSQVENLTLIGTANINGTGNTLANLITGNSANNTLNGGAGADIIIGGLGNDIYFVDNANDIISESLNEGIDKINSGITYTLPNEVEDLTLTGTALINGTGNGLANILLGNSAANVLDGLSGADTLKGGAGDDTYIIDSVGDIVTENLNAGIDTVNSNITFTLKSNIEHLLLTGTAAINGTGNVLANTITGNAAANSLNGATGADTLIGGLGDDIYTIDNAGDIIVENLNEGIDRVNSSASYVLSDNVENITLIASSAINATGNGIANTIVGNSASNQLIGGGGNDILNGAAGNNTLTGGTGKDYFQFKTADHITGGRIDTITDYNVFDDTIKLENSIFTVFSNMITPDKIPADQFVIGTQALDGNDFIIYNSATGAVLYDADGNSAGAAVQFATLSTGLALTNWDFHAI
ncbi:hypothetical protein ABF87_12880 [Nitrosomonas sp. JL21]|uniref:calcium-binding protein n=1 Tax=Nitrosomonas sp. JL21 TaxID=153949 RepID=UPI00136EEA20|nr:calcium-binding protein [Nitrosomonas sp. JL21]MBL8497077.1 putative Ig domain-containing protein [Nitrosomonas sp.]MXS78830.1 hypothetical protein [Nitrosomonas sp. JL21]